MIVTELKPVNELLDFLSPYSKILILGCDGCTQPPRSIKEAENLARLLSMTPGLRGKEFRTATHPKQCDSHLVVTELEQELKGIEAVLSLSCGVGVQTISEIFSDIPVFPAQNTLFVGMEHRQEGNFAEFCSACGDCILDQTGGICPVTRCAKGLLNGPCGGYRDGKCEVDPDRDCAWVLIYERLKRREQLEKLKGPAGLKDYSKMGHPRQITAKPT